VRKFRGLWPWLIVAVASIWVLPIRQSFPANALLALCLAGCLAALFSLLVRLRPHVHPPAPAWHALLYVVPPLVCWGFSLLAFFPGMMSSDSVDEWLQAMGTPTSDHHPILHILAEKALAQLWASPAIVAGTQIMVLSLLVGFCCVSLRRSGVSALVTGATSAFVALAPPNLTLSITLWKDIPYAAGLVALTVLLFRFEESPRPNRPLRFWAALGVAALAALSFRHNGFAAVLGAWLALVLLDRRSARVVSAVMIGALIVHAGLHRWAVRHYHADEPPASLAVVGLLSSHVAARTPLDSADAALLSELRPLDEDWRYNCLNVDSTLYDAGFHSSRLSSHDADYLALAVRLSLRAPSVSLHHLWCASSSLWRIRAMGAYLFAEPATVLPSGEIRSIDAMPGAPQTHSFLPGLRARLAHLFDRTVNDESLSWLIWRPALSLYVLLFSCAVACRRRRSMRLFAVLLPCLLHTAVLALLIPVQDLRYQYPVVLVSELFSLAFLALPTAPV
jgi:hypothetical protein